MNEEMRMAVIAYLDALDIGRYDDSWHVSSRIDHLRGSAVADRIGPATVSDGASKICLVFENLPFVIKWGSYDSKDAMAEVSIYQDAIAQGLAHFFPKTELFYTHNNISFVLQEKIDCSVAEAASKNEYIRAIRRITKTPTDKIYHKMQTEFNKASCKYRRQLDKSWAKMVISLYGKNVAKALCKFIIAHQINDLHMSNIGYKNFRPIILDFSGYHR